MRTTPTRPLSSVLLPEPFGPTREITSPGSTPTLMPRMTGSPPYPAVTPSARSGMPGGLTSADKVGLHDLAPGPPLGHGSLRQDRALCRHPHRDAEAAHDGPPGLGHA